MQIFMDTPLSLGPVCYPTETGSHTKVTARAEGVERTGSVSVALGVKVPGSEF